MPVGPSFFSTMQIPILLGRDIEERDRPGSPAVAIVNERFAKLNFAGRNPIGQRLIIGRGRGNGETVHATWRSLVLRRTRIMAA
jgi:hypothetical protein